MSNKTNGNNGLLLIAGAIAGAAATYYLNTPEGKKLTNKVFSKGVEVKDQFATTAKQVAEVT